MQPLEIVFLHVLDRRNAVLRALERDDELGELELERERVAILSVLDQEYHEECHDRRRRVDDELPSVAVAEEGAARSPDQDDHQGYHEGLRLSREIRGPVRQLRKHMRPGLVILVTGAWRGRRC